MTKPNPLFFYLIIQMTGTNKYMKGVSKSYSRQLIKNQIKNPDIKPTAILAHSYGPKKLSRDLLPEDEQPKWVAFSKTLNLII